MSSRVTRTQTWMCHGFHFPTCDELRISEVYNPPNLKLIEIRELTMIKHGPHSMIGDIWVALEGQEF